MKNRLLAAMALSCAASMSLWAGNWEKPTLKFVDPDLSIPTATIPTTGYKYINGVGDYYLYHLATGMFLTAGNNYGTTISIGAEGQLIRLGYGYDRFLYNAETYTSKGWLLTMPNATSNSSDGGRYHELFIKNQYEGFVDGTAGHMLWSILPQADGTYRISVIPEDPSFGPGGSEDIPEESYMGRNPESEEDKTTVIIPLATPGNMLLAEVDWKFVSVADYDTYMARNPFYELLNKAEESGMPGLDAYVAIYNNTASTKEELVEATEELKVAYKKYTLDKLTEGATAANPVDLTEFIVNAQCTSKDGWTVTNGGPLNVITNGEHWSGPDRHFLEPANWGSTTGFHSIVEQTLTDMPNGMYKLTASARVELDTEFWLEANGMKYKFPSMGAYGGTIDMDGKEWPSLEEGLEAGAQFSRNNEGHGWNYGTVEFKVMDGTITLGFESLTDKHKQWCSISDMKLLYTGKITADFVYEKLRTTITGLNEYKSELDLLNTTYSIAGGEAFEAEIASANEMLSAATASENEVMDMIDKLEAAKKALDYDVEVYAKMQPGGELFTQLDQLVENVPGDVALTTFDEYYGELDDAVNSRTFNPADYDGIIEKATALYKADFMLAVQSGNVTDITPLITNPDFANGATGWQGTSFTGVGNGTCVEMYRKKYDSYQIIEGLPAGSYEVSVRGYYRPGWNEACGENYGLDGDTYNVIRAYVYANNSKTPFRHIFEDMYDETGDGMVQITAPNAPNVDGKYVPNSYGAAKQAFDDGRYAPVKTVCVVGEDGVLRFGAKVEDRNDWNDDQGEGDWSAYTEFRITYLGESMEGYVAELQGVLSTAKDVVESADVKANDDVNELRSLMTAFELAMGGYDKAEQFTSAREQLNAAIAKVKEGIEVIKLINQQASEYMDANDNSAYEQYDTELVYALMDAAEEIYFTYGDNEFTTLEDVKELQKTMNEAYTNMIMGDATGSAEAPADVTALLKTPSFEDAAGAKSNAGWNIVVDNSPSKAAANLVETSVGDKTYHMYEMYNNASFNMSQTVYALKPGWYYVDMQGFYRAGNTETASKGRFEGTEARNVELYATTSEGETASTPISSIFEGIVIGDSQDEPLGWYSNDTFIPKDYLLDTDKADYDNYIRCYVPNSVQGTCVRFDLGMYRNRVAFEVKETTEFVTIGLKKDEHIDTDWAPFDNFQLFYTGNDKPTVSVEGIEVSTADVVKSTYYTIGGVRISKPAQSGLYIREDLLSDGTKKVTKIMVK